MTYRSDQILEKLKKRYSTIRFLETEGATTGRYREKHVIVFEYTNIAEEPCVLKFFSLQHIDPSGQEDEKRLLLEEFRTIKNFDSHPNVVRVYDANELRHDGHLIGFYITMEKFSATLADVIRYKDCFSGRQVDKFLDQMDRVLYHAHYKLEQPIVHSDIKPANIGIRKAADGSIQFALMDFDVSVSLERKSTDGHSFTLSNKASLRGITLAYAPPEQAMAYLHRSGDISNRVDVYAVGAIAMQMLTGIAPQKNESQVYYKLPFDRLPADWKPVFERLCAPDVKHRSRRVSDAVKTKGKTLPPPGDDHRTQVVRPRSGHRRQALAYPVHRSNKKPILAVAIAMCTVVLLGLVYAYFSGQDSQPTVAQAEQEQLVPVLPESEQETEQTSISEEETRTAQITRPETGRLTLQLEPADAQVTIDGESVETDAPIDLASGVYQLQVDADGYETYSTELQISQGDQRTVPVTLEAQTGALAVNVVPSNAHVTLTDNNGREVSQWVGNRTMEGLQEGVYRITVTADGYEHTSETVRIQANQTIQHSLVLAPLFQCGQVITDIDGNRHRTVSIGNQCWLAQNLGSTQQPSSFNDSSVRAAGWFWQFNSTQNYSISNVNQNSWNNFLEQNSHWLKSNDPCSNYLGSDWRIPAENNFNYALNNLNINDLRSAFNSPLKIHAGGFLSAESGRAESAGQHALFWTREQTNRTEAKSLYIIGNSRGYLNSSKATGRPVRCVLEP